MAEKEQICDQVKNENSTLNQQLQAKNTEIKKLIQDNKNLNNEFDKVNEEYSKVLECLSQTEAAVKSVQNKLNERTEENNELENRLSKLQADFKAYQQKYQYTHDDIISRENKYVQLEYELEEVGNQLQLIKTQNQELLNTNSNFKNDYEQLLEQKRNCEKEITHLESTISELQMNFTSNHQQLKKEVYYYLSKLYFDVFSILNYFR